MVSEPLSVARRRLAGAIGSSARRLWRRSDLSAQDEVILDLLVEGLVRVSALLRPTGSLHDELKDAPHNVRGLIARLVPIARREGDVDVGSEEAVYLDQYPVSQAKLARDDPELRPEKCIIQEEPLEGPVALGADSKDEMACKLSDEDKEKGFAWNSNAPVFYPASAGTIAYEGGGVEDSCDAPLPAAAEHLEMPSNEEIEQLMATAEAKHEAGQRIG